MEYKASLDDLLQWLSEKPRTMGWNCIVAYDRAKTNTVLLQEYIERFTTDSYLEPITTEIETTEGTVELIYDYIIDAGRLSFENAVISDSMARLTMRIIGGSQISLELVDGIPHVAKVKSIDALDGPLLYMDIRLEATQGKITDEGQVFLDLYKAFNVRLTFAATDHERELGGDFFDWYFKNEIDRDKQIHVLNELKVVPDQYLVPEEFHIRTHAAPGGRDPDSDVHGSGEVLLLVTTKGQENGNLVPDDADLHYLIPEGHSATMLLGHEFLMTKILVEGCRAMTDQNTAYDYEVVGEENEFVEFIRVLDGVTPRTTISPTVPGFRLFSLDVAFSLGLEGGAGEATCRVSDGKVEFQWWGITSTPATLITDEGVHSDHPPFWSSAMQRWYRFELDDSVGSLALVLLPDFAFVGELNPGDNSDIPEIDSRFENAKKIVEPLILANQLYWVDFFAKPASHIDIFRLNSLLFKGENVVQLSSAFLPGDLATFGNIAPSLTRFAITPLESDIGPGQKRQFATEPKMEGVTWSVEKVPGSSDGVGSIDARGEYTAPALSEISGSYTRIRVTAQVGEYRQSALINVVTRAINVNPMVMTCPVGTQTGREMSAGALGGGTLTWKIADPSSGATIKPSTITFGDHNFRPGPHLENVNVTVDEVVVTAPNGVSQSSPVVVVHNPGTLIIEYEDIGNPDKLQMRARFQGNLLPIDEPFEWTVIAGSGQIDKVTGVFTLDPEGQHKFAVITGVLEFAPSWVMKGFVILPIPLLPMPEALRVQRVHLQRNLPRE